jgi:tetratricopeptide (TPR) repeat protein
MTSRATDHLNETHAPARRQSVLLSLVVVAGMLCVFGLSRWMDDNRPPVNRAVEEERLYMTGTAVRRASLGFNGLVADWYWMRSLQYVGGKLIKHQMEHGDVQLDSLGSLDLRLLYPLLDTTTTLDPQFMAAYEYGAVVLPEINLEGAVRLLEKGIAANPSAWRLYHHLGYIYWQRGDYQRASATYSEGARLPGAAPWMTMMSAKLKAEGGSRATAREIYRRMYEESDDKQIKEMAVRRLMQVASLDERDVIRKALNEYAARKGSCAASWQDVAQALRAAGLRMDASGVPLDPSDTPYVLVKQGCEVAIDTRSLVPRE